MLKSLLAATLSLTIGISFGQNVPQEWLCMAFDAKERNFSAAAIEITEAMNKALHLCQKNSNQPKTCRSAQSFCEQRAFLGQGRCVVTDDDGHTWDIDGDNSCKQALAMCNRFIYLEGGAHGQCWIRHGGEGGNLDVD